MYLVKACKIVTYSRWAMKDDSTFLAKQFFYFCTLCFVLLVSFDFRKDRTKTEEISLTVTRLT